LRNFNTPNHREKASELPAPTGDTAEIASGTGVNNPPGNARASDGLNVNVNVNGNENGKARVADASLPSSEERMTRAFDTGKPQANNEHRVRSELRHLAGTDFVQKHAGDLASWTRWTNEQLRRLWDESKPDLWPGERHKQRAWIMADLLNEKRTLSAPVESEEEARERIAKRNSEMMARIQEEVNQRVGLNELGAN